MKRHFYIIISTYIYLLVLGCNTDTPNTPAYQAVERDVNTLKNTNPVTTTFEEDTSNFKDLVNTYENKDRVIWQQPDKVIRLFGNTKEKTIADIGAGTGYFTFRLAPLVKKVIGIDIDQRFITYMDSIKANMPYQIAKNIEIRLAKTTEPNLNKNEVDGVLIVNTYVYIENRLDYLQAIRNGMKKGGKIIIVDYNEKDIPEAPPANLRLPLIKIENELKSAGFTNITSDNSSLKYQYIITAMNQ